MTEQSHAPDKTRRKFLKGSLAVATGAAAASTVAGSALAGAADTEAAAEVEKKEEGYRLTKHIADYYKSAAV